MRLANAGTAVLAVVADGSFTPSVSNPSQAGLTGSCDPAAADYCGQCTPALTSPPSCGTAFGRCQAKCQFTVNQSAGQLVFGYVDTNFACRSMRDNVPNDLALAERTVDAWYVAYPQIQGIFFDDGPVAGTCNDGTPPIVGEAIQRADYDALYQHDVNNCGACGHVCPSGDSCTNGFCRAPPPPPPRCTRPPCTVEP